MLVEVLTELNFDNNIGLPKLWVLLVILYKYGILSTCGLGRRCFRYQKNWTVTLKRLGIPVLIGAYKIGLSGYDTISYGIFRWHRKNQIKTEQCQVRLYCTHFLLHTTKCLFEKMEVTNRIIVC